MSTNGNRQFLAVINETEWDDHWKIDCFIDRFFEIVTLHHVLNRAVVPLITKKAEVDAKISDPAIPVLANEHLRQMFVK